MKPFFSYARRIGDTSAIGTPVWHMELTLGRHFYMRNIRWHFGNLTVVVPFFTFQVWRVL